MDTLEKNSENVFYDLKVALLAAIFDKRYARFGSLYDTFSENVFSLKNPAEEDQKHINQIQLMVKRFKREIGMHCDPDIWAKWAGIKKRLAEIVKEQTARPAPVDASSWRKMIGLNDKCYQAMMKTVTSFQITSGCSNFCRRCNEWALPGVRKYFTSDAVIGMSSGIYACGNDAFIFYGASDPLDWQDGTKDIADVLSYFLKKGEPFRYGLLTKIPKGRAHVIDRLLEINADFAVSVTDKNRARFKALENRIGCKLNTQHEVTELLIPAGLDEDFSSVKPSITDNYGTEITPDGAFIIVPTFTSALNPTGQYRIPVTKHTCRFLEQKTGREALPVEYYKPFSFIATDGTVHISHRLLIPQIQNIMLDNGEYELTPPGMTSFKEFLSTFEKDAIAQRKSMIPSVVKTFKGRLFPGGDFREASGDEKTLFKQQLKDYADFTCTNKIKPYRIFTLSFYLESISNYLKNHPHERTITLHFRGKEKKILEKKYASVLSHLTKDLPQFLEFKIDYFDLFQLLLFRLLLHPEDPCVKHFIDTYPAEYDPERDRFVRKISI